MVTATDGYEGMIAETTALVGHGGDLIHAYLARPTGPGPFPAIVLFHHLPGWDEFYRETTRRFAHHGFIAISPDLYCREGHGEPDDVAARVRAEGGVPDEQVVGDAQGCLDLLRAIPSASGKVGVFGTCSGGRHAYLAACRTGGVDAVVNCWGGRIVTDEHTDKQPVAPIEFTADLAAPVLGLFGNDDGSPSPADVDALEAALVSHGKPHEFHRYDGAGHGFFYYDRPSAFRAEAAVDGWAKVWEFLDRTLR
jgi:carboxymethylenebutenolidase